MHKIHINSKIYYSARTEGWLNALSVYVYFCKNYTNRKFFFKSKKKTLAIQRMAIKLNVSFNTLNTHINTLSEKNLVFIRENEIEFASTKIMMGNHHKSVYVPAQISELKDIKIFLKSIPFLSNLYSQKRIIEKKEYLNSIITKVKKNYFIPKNEYKIFKAIKRKGISTQDVNKKIIATISKVLDCISKKSTSTAVKYKKLLNNLNVFKAFNSNQLLFSDVNYSDFTYLRSNDLIEFKYTFYKNRCIYKYYPTQFILL